MRHLLTRSLACSGLLILASIAYAQDRDRDVRHDDERYHRQDRDDSWWRGRLFLRVRDDLTHVQAVTSPFSADQYRLDRVKEELNELQNKYAERLYAEPELDDVISALQRVVSDNRLSGRDRDMLNDDLNRLREFREHQEGYR